MSKKVEALPETTSPIDAGLIVISESGTSKKVTKANLLAAVISSIASLTTSLASKATLNSAITPGTKTKITYDANGFVTSGSNATTADINESTNRRYLTDDQQSFIGGLTTEDSYGQPDIPYKNGGLAFKVVDMQVVTKFTSWDFLSPTQRDAMLDEVVATGATHVAFAVPYEQTTKYADWINRARAKGLLIWFRSHRNAWEGSDGVGDVTSISRSGTTATVASTAAHGLITGDKVWISGATPTAYNGLVTITVTDSTHFTYQVLTSPTTPATGTIRYRVDWESFYTYVYNWIKANPTFFRPGDLFGMAVENANADGLGSGQWNQSFRTGGNFDITKYKQSQLDQVYWANKAFAEIGLRKKIYTWAISTNVSLLDLNGITWNNTGGNASGLDYKDIITYFGGVLCIDHYQDAAIETAGEYRTAIRADLQNFKKSFPGCLYFQGEIGWHTEHSSTEQEQADVTKAIFEELLKLRETVGINLWVQMGSSNTSYWDDVTGNIVAGGRLAVRAAVIPAFKKNELYTNFYSDGDYVASRESINFTGEHMRAIIEDDDDHNRVNIDLEPVISKTTRHNYVPNPSFEVALLSGWSVYGTYDTVERVTAQFNNGVASFHISNATTKDGGIISDPIALPAGTYTVSAYIKISANVDNAHLVAREVGGDSFAGAITQAYPGNTNWNRYSYSFTIATPKNVEILIGLGSYGAASDGEAWFDGLMLEEGGSVGTYFDGDTTDGGGHYYSWSGDSNESASLDLTFNNLINDDGDLVFGSPGVGLEETLAADGDYQGIVVPGTAGATLAFGDCCYLDNDNKWRLAGAGLSDSYDKKLGLCALGAANNAATRILLFGTMRADAKFPTFAMAGAPVYLQSTLGAIGTTKPSTSGHAMRIVGFADTGDQVYFQPDGNFASVS